MRQFNRSPYSDVKVERLNPRAKSSEGSTASSNAERHTGKVKFYNRVKGWGFAESDNPNHKDIFIHMNHLEGMIDLQTADKISFEIEEKDGKLKGKNVRLA